MVPRSRDKRPDRLPVKRAGQIAASESMPVPPARYLALLSNGRFPSSDGMSTAPDIRAGAFSESPIRSQPSRHLLPSVNAADRIRSQTTEQNGAPLCARRMESRPLFQLGVFRLICETHSFGSFSMPSMTSWASFSTALRNARII